MSTSRRSGAIAPLPRVSPPGIGRDLALFQVYRFLSTSYLFAPIIVVFFRDRGLTLTQITLLNTVYCVTAMLFEVPTGVLADRWGRRRAMVLGSLMMAAGCAVNFLGSSFAAFAIGESLLALGMTLTSGADSAYLYDLLLDAGRENEYRRREGAATAAKLVGAAAALAVGGWLAMRHLGATYLVTAGVCLLAAVVALLLREPPPAVRPRRVQLLAQVVAGLRTVARHPPLRFAVLFSALVFTLVRLSIYLHPMWLAQAGYSHGAVGGVMAALSFVAALGAHRVDALRRAVGERTLVIAVPAALAASYLALGGAFTNWGIAMLAVQGLANGIYSPLSKELLNREILDSSQRATVLSVESMVRRVAFGAFPPVVAWINDHHADHGRPGHGLALGMFACAAFGLAGTGWLVVHVLRRRASFGGGFVGERTPTPLPELEPSRAAPEVVPTVAPRVPRMASGSLRR